MPDIEKTLETLRDDYFKTINRPVGSVYVDMEMICDFRLGALLSTFTVAKEMEYLYTRIPAYNERYDLDTAKYFPALKKTDAELDEIIRNCPGKVARVAPWTEILQKFVAAMSLVELSNKNLDPSARLSVVINCQDFRYPEDLAKVFRRRMASGFKTMSIEFTNGRRYSQEPGYYAGFDMLFLYDYATFMRDERLVNSFTSNYAYMNKSMYVLPLVDEACQLDRSEYLKALISTKARFDIYTDFYYMTGGIPLAKK